MIDIENEKEKIWKSLLTSSNNIEVTESNIANNLVIVFDNEALSLPKTIGLMKTAKEIDTQFSKWNL